MKRGRNLVVLAALLVPGGLAAQEVKPADAETHQQLIKLRENLIDAFNKQDLGRLLTYVHPDVVVTWQNGEVSRGHQGIRAYYDKMMKGDKRVVESATATAEADEKTRLYGERYGLTFGSVEDFKLTDGSSFRLPNRWTAHVIKDGDRWLVSDLHVSANVFDNPILGIAIKRTAWWVGGIAGAVGILVGVLLTLAVGRFRRRAA